MPGHKRAILLVIPKPNAIESHRSDKETNAVARDKYQYAFGPSPLNENAKFGKTKGSNNTAINNPITDAKRKSRNDWMLIDDSLKSF